MVRQRFDPVAAWPARENGGGRAAAGCCSARLPTSSLLICLPFGPLPHLPAPPARPPHTHTPQRMPVPIRCPLLSRTITPRRGAPDSRLVLMCANIAPPSAASQRHAAPWKRGIHARVCSTAFSRTSLPRPGCIPTRVYYALPFASPTLRRRITGPKRGFLSSWREIFWRPHPHRSAPGLTLAPAPAGCSCCPPLRTPSVRSLAMSRSGRCALWRAGQA